MADMPIVCTLGAEALHARREGLLADVLRRAELRELTEHGLRMRFTSDTDTVATLARVVDAERQCCCFLRFVMTVEPDAGAVWLELFGPTGTREFLAGLLDL